MSSGNSSSSRWASNSGSCRGLVPARSHWIWTNWPVPQIGSSDSCSHRHCSLHCWPLCWSGLNGAFFVLSGTAWLFSWWDHRTVSRALLNPVLIGLFSISGLVLFEAIPNQDNQPQSYLPYSDSRKQSLTNAVAKKLIELSDDSTLPWPHPNLLSQWSSAHQTDKMISIETAFSWPHFAYRTLVVAERQNSPYWEREAQIKDSLILKLRRPEGVPAHCLYGIWTGPIVEEVPRGTQRLQPKPAVDCSTPK